MRPPPIHLLAAVCFAAFALAGWQAATPEKPATPSVTETPSAKASKRGPRTAGKSAMPEDVRQRLAAIHAARTPDERLRATLALAHSLPVSEMERWYQADWFDFHDNMDSNLFSRITRARWLAEDPEGLMSYFLRRNNDKTHETAERWASQDPRGALAFMEGVKDKGDFQKLASAMAGPLAEADPALAVALVLKLQTLLGEGESWAVSEMIEELANNSPALLESESANWPAGLRETARQSLVNASLKKDFTGGIATLRDVPDGKKRFLAAMESDRDMIKEMMKNPSSLPDGWFAEAASANPYYLVNENPGQWLDTDLAAMGFNTEQSQRLLRTAMSYLGQKDPDRALALLDGDTLDANQRNNLLSFTLSSLASKDKARAEAWIATLTDPQEIEQARKALENASAEAEDKTPPTPSEWLTGLVDKDESAMWQYNRLAQSWDRGQSNAVAAEFAGLPADQKSVIAAKLADDDQSDAPVPLRAEAIRHLLENPAEPDPEAAQNGEEVQLLRSASNLASTWGREDPAAAGRWIRSLPAGDERLWAAKNLAGQWAEYEPAAARQWAASLPADERKEDVEYLESGSAQERCPSGTAGPQTGRTALPNRHPSSFRSVAVISSRPSSPAATARVRFSQSSTLSVSSGRSPFSLRKTRQVASATRLLPSTKGWLPLR